MNDETEDQKDAEIFALQMQLTAAEARITELEDIVSERLYGGRVYDKTAKASIPAGAQHGENVLSEEEKPYRRGYSQGLSMCRQFVEEAVSSRVDMKEILQVLRQCESQTMKWRAEACNWTRGKIVKACWPPEPFVDNGIPKSILYPKR